jgi:hypothetical protein
MWPNTRGIPYYITIILIKTVKMDQLSILMKLVSPPYNVSQRVHLSRWTPCQIPELRLIDLIY